LEQVKDLRDLLDEEGKNPVRVAILDTGVDLPRGMPSDLKPDRYESYSWIGVSDDKPEPRIGDPDGHGTHMTSIFLSTAGTCKLYVVQVAGARKEIRGKEANDAVAANIARVSCQSSKNMAMQLTQH
jgi:hypothetical protein